MNICSMRVPLRRHIAMRYFKTWFILDILIVGSDSWVGHEFAKSKSRVRKCMHGCGLLPPPPPQAMVIASLPLWFG